MGVYDSWSSFRDNAERVSDPRNALKDLSQGKIPDPTGIASYTSQQGKKALSSLEKVPQQLKIPAVPDAAQITAPPMPTGLTPYQANAPAAFQGGQIAQVAGPQASMVNADPTFRNAQTGLLDQMQNEAAGGPNSISQQLVQRQAQQAQGANQAAIFSQLASQRGAANPLAARTAAMLNAQQGAQIGANATLAGLQAQQQAQAGLANFAGNARQQDIGTALANQQAQNEMQLAGYQGNVQSAIAQGGLNQRTGETMYGGQLQTGLENARLGSQFQDLQSRYANMGLTAAEANQRATMDVLKMRNDAATAQAGLNRQMAGSGINAIAGLAGTIGGGMLGGPAGAAAGDAVGNAVGNQFGSSGNGTDISQGSNIYNPDTGSWEDTNNTVVGSSGGAQRAYERQRGGM